MAVSESTKKSTRLASRKQVLTDLRRSEIIEAALKVFARKGFHHSRTEDVATQAHIAKGTLYLYFDSKDAIYDAALQHAIDSLSELSDERVAAAKDTRSRVEAWIHTRLDFWCSRGDMYHMILTVGRETRHRKQTATLLRSAQRSFVDILQQAVDAGDLPPRDLSAIGWLVMDAIRGSNERRILNLCERDISRDTAIIVDTVMRYFA
ncbi:TetR/AcrR family transcriptional regulator [Terriglobus sp. TAA 43]|uniref:TetR/AcrR family transcriptional regulator n=1 Tax=Terriglobus sp. TAA 43 TaxID=278961 RepID=UPI00068F99E3|nr:TetR/AcrR family transcriptional regulator [Terriglobus sp. TAA 43]